MSLKVSNFPLVVVCGGTGTGKSKLAIEIAKHYGGEVINADALQIYTGMDIATNKVTKEECNGVKHHLLGFESVETLDYTVHEFQKAALDKIFELKNQNKMPVLVGGTNYYIESILWHRLVNVDGCSNDDVKEKLDLMSNNELHEYLRILDSQSAILIHPNCRRKVYRAVEIALNSSINQNRHLENQLICRRFPLNDTVFIWINSEKESLFPRLEKRVEEMVSTGLLPELEEIQKLFLKHCPTGHYTRGIFQAIGFKEFHEYLNYEHKESDVGRKILGNCVERLKVANKQYVRVQNKWIKNRFLKESTEESNIPLFKVDSSDVTKWDDNVLQRSLNIIEQVRRCTNEEKYSVFVQQLEIAPEKLNSHVSYTPCNKICHVCDNKLFVTLQSWDAHLKGRKHQKMSKRLRLVEQKNKVK